MTNKRAAIFVLSLLSILVATFLVIQAAKGYHFDFGQKNFLPTGLLVTTSYPDGGQIFINGGLTGATNTTLSLAPNTYMMEIKKDGFYSWQKTVRIEKELVTKIDAWLFPLVPDFRALTFTSAQNPLLSPDGSKIIYRVLGDTPEKNGLWVLDLTDLPFGLSREPKLLLNTTTKIDLTGSFYSWSPDSRQVLVSVGQGRNFLLDPNNGLISAAQLTDITSTLPATQLRWQQEETFKQQLKMAKLPPQMAQIIQEKTQGALFSPDENKILYTATASATIPDHLIPPLPGPANSFQERQIKQGRTYVYAIKEDQNFLIIENPVSTNKQPKCQLGNNPTNKTATCFISWFPTSRHLLVVEDGRISVLEDEGTNQTTLYAGSYQFPFAFPFPSGNKLLLLTSLSNTPNSSSNLYAVKLR